MLIIICLFLRLLICLRLFLASNESVLASNDSCVISFHSHPALVLRFFFTNLLGSADSILSFSVLFAFCRNSFHFLSKVSISVSSVLFLIVDCSVVYGVRRFGQDFVHFLHSWFLVFQSDKCVSNSIQKGLTNFSHTLRSCLSGVCFWISFTAINFFVFLYSCSDHSVVTANIHFRYDFTVSHNLPI